MADLATGNLGLFMKTSGLNWWGPELTAVEGNVNFDKEQLYSWPAPGRLAGALNVQFV